MSHYTVLVIGGDPEGMLTPYNENPDAIESSEYFEFKSEETPGNRLKWKNETARMIRTSDGKLEFEYNLKDKKDKRLDWKTKKGYKEEEVPLRVIYTKFKQFLEEYLGVPFNVEHKKHGYLHNIYGAKWDWYELGGRWAGMLPLIKDEESKYYELASKPGYADQAPLRLKEYLLGRYIDAKGYAKSQSTFHTYAVLNDDGWKAPGEMGWFGCSSETPEALAK